ncbi:hypothetical protein MHZ93_03795 [Roseomonas sp. ACRSG]|nr:hypothetical protein [Roseomonas sp. ACRSG]
MIPMLSRRRTAVALAFLLGAATGCAPSSSGPGGSSPRAADATLTIEEVQVAFIGSGDAGHGTLRFRGSDYPFRVTGLGVGGIGASRLEADGEVYNLNNLQDFAGTYGRARAGYAIGDVSGGGMWMENGAGVVLRLRTRREGLMLSLGGDVMVISFR